MKIILEKAGESMPLFTSLYNALLSLFFDNISYDRIATNKTSIRRFKINGNNSTTTRTN